MQWCFQIKDYFLYFGDCSVFTTERNDGKHYKNEIQVTIIWNYPLISEVMMTEKNNSSKNWFTYWNKALFAWVYMCGGWWSFPTDCPEKYLNKTATVKMYMETLSLVWFSRREKRLMLWEETTLEFELNHRLLFIYPSSPGFISHLRVCKEEGRGVCGGRR